MFSKIFLRTINIIGPTKSPIIPINLKPVYIDINVNIGCIPILLLTILGSSNCLAINIITYNIISAIPNFISPFKPEITAQGTITVPEPKIGSASTNPMPNAARSGNSIGMPITFKKYNPNKNNYK